MSTGSLILVVDDNAANAFALSTMVKKLGFEADMVSSGMEAINHACQREYDVILMDHLMPDMDGVAAIKQIRFICEKEKKPVIIGISATIDEEVTAAFENVGADGVLEKPVKLESLKEKLTAFGIRGSGEQDEELPTESIDADAVFSGVKGLDYQKGIELLAGSIDNYVKVLGVCVRNIRENYDAIDLIRDTSQLERFALHFHSLKGIFLNIGADGLAEESKTLEMAAKAGELEEIKAKLTEYMRQVDTFDVSLGEAYDSYNAANQAKYSGKEVSASEFAKKLEKLAEYIQDFEYIEITETLEELLNGCSGEKRSQLEKVSDAIQSFDYDEALELVEALKVEKG